jgi:hypothetical protein
VSELAYEDFLDYETVGRYAGSLADLTGPERETRLRTLHAFAVFVERTPDQMVEEIYNKETRKYRKRGFYTERIKAFQEQLDGGPHRQLAQANVIRSFFIANGFRIPPERPAWM